MEENLQSIYDKLASLGSKGSYSQFVDYFNASDENKRAVYDKLAANGSKGSYEQFLEYAGVGQQQPAQRVDVSDVEQAEQPQVPQIGADDVAVEGDGRFKPSWGFERSQKMQDKMPEPKPAIKTVNEKTEYDFSPENVQGMREFAEGAYVKAFDEVNALMPEIERSIRERALFDTEQNNRNKDASREAIEYHANKEADRRIKQFREKIEKEGTAGFSGESLASYLAFDDEELRDKIASAYNDKDAVDKYMQAYYQSPEGKAERTREADNAKVMVDELKGKRSQGFWNTVGGMFGDMAISASMAEGGMSYQDQQQLSKIQDGIRRTNSVNMAINQSLHEAENTLNVAIKNIEEGKGNAFVQLGRGIRYANLDNVIPMSDLYGQLGVLQLYEKLDEDGKPKEPLTQDEQTLYESLALNKYVSDRFGGYQTMLNRIGSGLPEQAMFTLSFLLSSEFAGAQTIGRGATNVLRRGIGNVVNKEIKSGIGRFMLDKALPTAFGMGAETLYRTGLQVPAIMSGGIERHVGTIKVNPDTGEVGGFENGVDWDEALWKSTLNVANETGTELVGDRIIEPWLGWFGRNTAAGKRIADFRKYIGEIGDGTVDDILKMGDDISRKAGWSKWYIEVGEEEVGAFNNAAFIHDQTWEEAFSRKALMETTLNCMIFGVAMGTSTTTAQAMRNMPSTVTTRNEKRKASRIIDKMDGISTDEIDEHINNDSSNELADWLVDKSAQGNSNGDWTDSQRAAVANYVRTSVAQKAERHYKDMQLQNEVKAMEERVDDMTNNQSGDVIEANFKIDGQMQTGTIVGGRVSVVENDVIDNEGNPKQAFIYNPNLSSVTLIVRVENPDGTVTKKQVSARDIESINSVAEAEQYKGERRSELEMDMQRSVVDMYTTPTASAIWGTDLQAGVVLPYNDMLLRLDGKDENGQWILTRVDEEGTPVKKTNPFVLSDSEFRIMGMTERLRAMQQQGAPQEDIDDAIDDINTEQDLQNIDQSDDENNIWDNIAGFMKGYTQTNEEGDFIPEASRPEAAAGYLVALQKGDIGKTIAIVNERIAELEARLASKPAEVQNNGEGVVAMAGNESMAEDAYIETKKQIMFLSNIRDGLIAKQEQQNEIEEVKFTNTPVSQMEVGQQFPVEWKGQPAMATVMSKDADGRSVVTVRDMDGEDIEAGIDDMSDAQWEAVRVQPQEATAPEQVPPQAAPQAPEQVEPQQEVPQAAPQSEPQPQQEAQQEQRLPMDKDGNIDYEQITDPALYAQGLLEEFGDEAIDTINDLINEETEALAKAGEKKNAIERRRAQKESQGKLDFYYKVKDALTPQEQVETPTEEAAPVEEAPIEQPVAETPVEEAQPEQAPEQEATEETEPIAEETIEEQPSKPTEKEDSEFQKRIAAVGEPRNLEEAILMDIALGGAKFRWGNRNEDKKVLKRGIGDLWKYDNKEFRKRIGIVKKDGFSIETYAEAILAGQLQPYSGAVSQQAEGMDFQDIVAAIEDVLQMVTSKTGALQALEENRQAEAEEEQRYIRSLQDKEARDMGFEDWEDYENYQKSLEENNLTDDDYEEINRIFAEQTQEEDEQRARTSESEGDTAANQSDEQQGVRGESEGGTGVLQGTQVTDTGATEPTGQSTRSESGDTTNAAPQGEGADEVRAEIDRLKAQRASIVSQRDEIQQRYEQANGLFGDTQADENDLFEGQSFLSPELAQATIDGYNRQIKQIDEQIAKLEASLKRAEGVTQTEIEQTAEVAPEDIETAAANPAATETKVEKGLTMEEVDAAEGIDTQTKLLAKEYIKGNKNELTKDAYEEVREYYAERGRRNPEQNGGTASGTQLAAADNEAQDQRGGGQRGVESGRVDREGSEATLPEDNGRGENGAQQPSATAGEQGVNIGNGEQLGTSGQPVDSGNTTGGSRSGGNGSDVRQPRGEKEGSGVSGTGTRGQSGTSKRRSADEIDKDIADDLAAISSLFKEFVADQKKMGIAANPEEQAKADIAWFRNVRKAIFKLAGHVFERGYTQFDEWKNKIKDLLHSAIKNFRDKLSDERLDQLLADAWECPFERNGEVKTIREWASELHAEEVRKMLSKSIEEKRKEQEEANKKHIKQVHGDLDNIKATLPFLLPHQQENVAKAERQFFSEEHADREHGYGKGYCFTDGTGTGKTFTGLGIARRFVNEGKGRILILTTKTKVNDWVADGAKMGLDVTSLEAGAKKAGKTPTEFKGSGIVCTTYANARQNKALLEDVFDLVIYDESHYIMNNKGGEETISTKSHYMLTNKNIENALARLQEIHPLWIKEQELVEERQAQEAIIRNDEASYATQQAAVARISQIDGQLKQIKEQQKDELPAMREKAAEAAKITKAVFLSATPFKSIDNLEYAEGYLFSYPEEDALTKGSTDHRSGKDEFKLRFFGSMYRWRHHQIEEHVQNLDAAVQQQQAFADRLMETLGTMSGQVLDNGYDYSRHFPLVEVAMADQFNSAVEAINRDPVLRVLGEYFPFDDYQKMSVLFETMKVAAMLPRIKEHLAKGRKVVIFNRRTNYPQPTPAHPNPWVPQNPFVEGLATAIATAKQSDEKKAEAIMNAVNVFQERYGSLIAWADKLDYRLPAEQLKDAFGDKIEVINGKVTGKKRQAIIDKFNRDDDQGLDLLLGQEITMREGISIHDTTGNKQRVVMSLALPQETTTFIQGEGRIYRIGNKSNAIFEYPLLGINRELQLFALSFNAAVGVTENLAMGSSARNLARSIAKGVMEDSGVVPMENQGIGGREKDYGKSTRDAYSSAINDYYSNQKQKAGRENRLGQDYYATPEPLGFKMVQWLNLAEGEEVLEPSAGHGAIARYFPNNVRSLAIEPSDALFTMLALNTGGVDKDNAAQASGKNKFVQNGTFEDLKTINKYDAIAMNPPFGHAGATAIEHLEKAWQHLRNSGRIAIIVPTGAMDKKMEKWFDEHKNAVVVGEIKLPSVTFQQAGTSVSTRMLLIDRVDRASFRQKVAAKRVTLDMTGMQNIDELFRELRDIDMPSRMIDPATKLLRHGDALRTKLVSNDIVDYKRNPQTDRRSKNMGKDMTVGEEGVSMYLSNKAKGMNYDFYYSQRANWNDIKKLRGRDFFNKNGYVYLSDLANCETLAEANEKRLMDKWNSTQENFEQAKEFAEAMTDFIRRVTGFTDEQIRDYAAGKIDLFDYTKIKDNAQLTFQDLTQRYEDMEQDPMLQALFEQVSTIAERIGMKIETFNDPYTTVMGSYNPLTNTLRINSGRWNNPSESDSAKSQTILHELIHSVTSYALNAYDKGLPMSEGLKEACRRTYEIFENVKGDYTSYYGSTQVFAPSDAPKDAKYGFANTHEMLAEMANPNFRKYLQRKGLWKKLVDGIQRILNYLGLQNLGLKFTQNMNTEQYRRWYGTDKENVETATNAGWVATNAFDELSETLDMFLDNFDAALYERRNDGIVRAKIVEQQGDIFVSNAARAVEGIKQEKATPEQWLKMIEKQGGLKAGEDKWLGLSQWLKDQANTDTPRSDESLTEWAERNRKKTLTKKDVLDFINENAIKIEETEYEDYVYKDLNEYDFGTRKLYKEFLNLGGNKAAFNSLCNKYKGIENIYEFVQDRRKGYGNKIELKDGVDIDDAVDVLKKNKLVVERADSRRMQYTTEGLKNKREIALTVPTIEPWNESDEIHFGDAGGGRAVAWIRFGDTEIPHKHEDVDQARKAYNDYIKELEQKYSPYSYMEGGSMERDMMTAEEKEHLADLRNRAKELGANKKFIDKVLVIDEIQSKRHQEGREKGYNDPNAKVLLDKFGEAFDKWKDYRDSLAAKYNIDTYELFYTDRQDVLSEDEKERDKELADAMETARAKHDNYLKEHNLPINEQGIPAAPFEKNWMELAMKRMLRLAAEEGYDKVAWTTGEQQAERYNLGQQIDELSVYHDSETGLYDVSILPKGGDVDTDYERIEQGIDENRLQEVLGKDLYKRVAEEGNQYGWDMPVTITGDDLRIGGEGMKGFYDKMLPSFMNKYGKQWGVKVGEVTLPNVEEAGRTMWAVDVTDAMKESVMQGQVMFRNQEREYASGEMLPITKGENGYRVEGLNDSYPNLDRLLDAWRDEHLDYFAEIRNGKLYVEPWNLPEPKTAKEKRYLKKSRERAWRNMHTRADDTIKKLGLQDRVTILDSTDGLEGKKKTAKGWFDPATGKIVIVMPNHRDPHDVMKTILHEGVAHYGLRQLVGNDNMNEFLGKVFEHASKDVRDRIIDLAMNKYNRNVRKATEEYLAGLAESTNFEDATEKDWFKKIKAWFMQMLYKVGIDFGNFGEAVDNATFWGDRFTDNELRYLLWKSYRNLVADAESRAEIARDAVMQSALEVGNFAPAVAAESMAMESPENGTEQIYSKNFKRWFGDWENEPENASKVVDEDGKPLVVYHGRSEQFSTFERRKGVRFVMGLEDEVESEGFFFTPDRDFAEQYAANAERRRGGNRNTIACYLNIRRPLDLTSDNFAQLYEEVTGYEYQLGMDDITNLWEIMDIEGMADKIKSKGYDGVIFAEERADDGTVTEYSYCVFDPNQIKSATDNNGGFDPDNDDIYYRDAEPTNRIADEYNRMTGANVSGVNAVKRGWEKFARDQFDGYRPLEQMQKLIEKALGRKLRDSEKAYELATQLTSKTGQQIEREQLSYMVPVLQQVTDVIKALKDADGYSRDEAYDKVTNYMLAKHGLERNEWFKKQGKDEGDYSGLRGLAERLGYNPDDYKTAAEATVKDMEDTMKAAGIDVNEFWKTVNALTNRMLEISYESGMIDKDTFEDLKKRHKYYVPLRGFAEGAAADLFDYITQSPHFQNIFQKATGRESMADDPLANLMSMLQSSIVIGNQNQVMQKIYNLAVNSNSDLLRITKPWYVYNDATNTWEEKYPDIPEDATADEIDAIVKQFDADMAQLKANGKAKRKYNRIDVGKKLLRYQAKEHEMVAYIDGQRVLMHVAGNPLVAQAMNRANTQRLNKVMQGIQTITRWYSAINTSWSPAFGPKNAERDIRMMLFGAYTTGGIKKMWQSARDMVKAGWALPRLLITGKMDGGLVKALGKQKAAQLEQWWNEFLDNGGETGFTRTLNAEKAKGEVKDMIRHMLNGSKDGENRVRKYTIGLIEWIGRYSEDISRFAAYCQQRAQGESVLSSIQEAKNVTVNFNVKGGGDLAANMRALYSFFNASMQGINRMRRLATEHPGRFSAGIAAMMLGGAVLPWLNMAMFAMLGGDDDDWRKYEELTEYTANHNMILYVGNHKFISIPWSQELAPFNALGNIWFRQQMGWNKGRSVAEQWGDMFVDLSPVSVASGNKPGVGLVKTIMPSFTTPIWESLFNEDFTGSPLYKDNQWNKYDAAWEKAYVGKTSQSVIDASRWLNEKTDIDINPAIAEHLFSGVLGGMGRSGDKLLRYFTNGFQLQDAPFIRTMMFDSNPRGYIGAVQREYGRLSYDVLPKVKHDVDDMTATELASFTQTEEFEIANLVSIYKTGKDLAGNKRDVMGIDKMEKEYKKLAGMSDGSEEYREHLEAIKADITERKMELLDEIEQIKYEHANDLRKRIIDRVNEVERESKEKYKRRNGEEK